MDPWFCGALGRAGGNRSRQQREQEAVREGDGNEGEKRHASEPGSAERRAEKCPRCWRGGVGTLPFVFKQEWPDFHVKVFALLQRIPHLAHKPSSSAGECGRLSVKTVEEA